ncbi:MAG: type II toxin-antitoxin system HicA family toxin [Desulfobacteraceae bacterium]|nr:type II toxin-antitoxin system HicA family toxin [Desulfobacteraceae bacterium]MCB9495249.1 type II toxin-antitoxin system HicA family toxin [Desulfobacteraceae bacterium]
MGILPALKAKEVASILESLGFIEIRQRGSHKQYRNSHGKGTTVPFHPGRDISPILLRKICKDIDISVEDFLVNR